MKALYEHQEEEIGTDVIDGTEGMLGDDTLETDYDLEDGPIPPPGFWRGTHYRDGARVPGFTEAEYQAGESWNNPGTENTD